MKLIKTLQLLINVFFVLLLFGAVGSFISIPFILTGHDNVKLSIFETKINELTPQIYVYMLISLIVIGVFTLGVFWLKKTTRKLANNDFYSPLVIVNFKRAGTAFLVVGLTSMVTKFAAGITINSHFDLSIAADSNSNFFLIITGLFFMFFSEVLRQGKKLKEENDLTV